MQQFVVPQFIDVEDKIFGPITTRQFLILLVAGLIIFLAYRFGDFSLFVFVLAFVGGLSLVVAFAKINGQTFHYFLLNIIQTLRRPGLRVWRKEYSESELKFFIIPQSLVVTTNSQKKKVLPKRIRDLALVVNTGGFYQPEDEI
ncbi:MAG: PrgI family protein [Candidatus Magasanikbacteria bacterium]|nr:PrgI family protein [Candidatus Magasanikbacteria bacterium]